MKYKHLIFDLYGTLVDIHTDEEQEELWEKLALFYGYYGAAYTGQELKRSYLALTRQSNLYEGTEKNRHEAYPELQIEHVFDKLYTDKGVQTNESLVVHTGQFFRVLSTEYVTLYPGAKEALEQFRNQGYKLWLLSNAQRIFTAYELSYLGIEEMFDSIYISSDYQCKKPDKHFFHRLLDEQKLDPGECLMIGNDLQCDISGAKKVGIDSYYIHSNISPEFTDTIKADYTQMEMDWKFTAKQILVEAKG